MCRIWRWHFTWNGSNVFSSHERNVEVSAAYMTKRISYHKGLVQTNLGIQLKDLVTPYPAQGGHD